MNLKMLVDDQWKGLEHTLGIYTISITLMETLDMLRAS